MGRTRHLALGIGCLLCGLILTLHAQDSTYARRNIAVLTAPEMWGRGGSHNGEQLAARYIHDQLGAMGAQPLTANGYQYYEFAAHKMEGRVEMSLNGNRLSPFWDYRVAPYAHTTHLQEAPVVQMDLSLINDPAKLMKFYDRHAYLIRNGFIYLDGVEWRDKNFTAEQAKEALRSLTYNNPFGSKGILIGVDELPVWGLSSNDTERNYALIYVKRDKMGKRIRTVSVDFDNKFYMNKTQNICYQVRGTQQPDSLVVLTAHYDHLGSMGDSVVFYGAHDNASGTSGVLDLARHFCQNPPKYTMVFLFFSGEESGLRGSRYFVEHPLIDFSKVKMLINIDMLCGGEEGFTVVNSTAENTKPFYDKIVEINEKEHLVAQVKPRSNAANRDHYFFSEHCPAIFIYTMGGRYGGYHHFTDTCDRCGMECYHNIMTLILKAIDSIR